MGQPFLLVGTALFPLESEGTPKEVSINDFVSGDFQEGDQIQIPSGSSTRIVTWGVPEGFEEPCWCDAGRGGRLSPSDAMITTASGVWIHCPGATLQAPVRVTFLGRVGTASMMERTVARGARLFSLPTPQEIAINDACLSWGNLAEGDELQVPRGTSTQVAKWHTTADGSSFWAQVGRGGTATDIPSTITVDAHRAFWVISPGSGGNISLTYSNKK